MLVVVIFVVVLAFVVVLVLMSPSQWRSIEKIYVGISSAEFLVPQSLFTKRKTTY